MNQIQLALDKLKKSHYTRRAVATTWHAEDAKSDNPPCLNQIIWNIQFNRLYQTAVFRSYDIFASMPMNMLALRKLQEDIAKELGVETAQLSCFAASAHIYETNWKQAMEILEKHKKPDYRFHQDPRGSFVIRIEGSEIVADFYTEDGSKTQYSFRGTEPIRIYKEIAQSHLIKRIDHAANLGMELYKASLAIKYRKKYVQDEELV
jgi:thymidylate synthase